jgi:hypothetical protein
MERIFGSDIAMCPRNMCGEMGLTLRCKLCKPKICNPSIELLIEQDVAGLHISVDDLRYHFSMQVS